MSEEPSEEPSDREQIEEILTDAYGDSADVLRLYRIWLKGGY